MGKLTDIQMRNWT